MYSVMCMADLYLITGLKQLCANKIRQLLDVDNVIPILRASRLFSLGRLEADCCQFIATVLEKVHRQNTVTLVTIQNLAKQFNMFHKNVLEQDYFMQMTTRPRIASVFHCLQSKPSVYWKVFQRKVSSLA